MKVGLQLYSVREAMQENMDKALEKVKEVGYDYVEFAGFFDKTADEVNALLEKHGLKAISVHQGISVLSSEGNYEYLKKIGVKYAAVPYIGGDGLKGGEQFDENVRNMKKISDELKNYGIRLMYHNHAHEFKTVEGKYLNDWLIEGVGEDKISPELDVCWSTYGGAETDEYILKYSGNIPVLHMKDFIYKEKENENDEPFKQVPVGSGCVEWEKIFAASEKAGTEYYIVEQDSHYGDDAFENVKKSRDFLKKYGY